MDERSISNHYVAIDPLALILPSSVYPTVAEKIHPHVPEGPILEQALKQMSPEERKFTVKRAKILKEYCDLIVKIAEK